MLVYVGKINYSSYASDEMISVVFRDNLQVGDTVAVLHQWSKDAGGHVKANSDSFGTVNKMSVNSAEEKEVEIFHNERERTYYWFKGKATGNKMTLSMFNKSGEEVVKAINLRLVFF